MLRLLEGSPYYLFLQQKPKHPRLSRLLIILLLLFLSCLMLERLFIGLGFIVHRSFGAGVQSTFVVP